MPHTPGIPDALFHVHGKILHLADPKDRARIRRLPGGAISVAVTPDEPGQPVMRGKGEHAHLYYPPITGSR